MVAPNDAGARRQWSKASYEVDGGIGTRAHIGMIVMDNDQTLSYEARAMLTLPGVALYESRISTPGNSAASLSVDLLKDVFSGLDEALAQINARRTSDVVALGCTSAAMIIGPQELQRRVQAIHPKAHVIDPFSGIVGALRTVNAKRIGYVSPYPRDVAEKMISAIEANGFSIPAASEFYKDGGVVRFDSPFISAESIRSSVRNLAAKDEVDTIIVSCTQMRAAAVIEPLEAETGKNIITSNQALCWQALRLAGYDDSVKGWGKLFTL